MNSQAAAGIGTAVIGDVLKRKRPENVPFKLNSKLTNLDLTELRKDMTPEDFGLQRLRPEDLFGGESRN